jgi:hypothetical protein
MRFSGLNQSAIKYTHAGDIWIYFILLNFCLLFSFVSPGNDEFPAEGSLFIWKRKSPAIDRGASLVAGVALQCESYFSEPEGI